MPEEKDGIYVTMGLPLIKKENPDPAYAGKSALFCCRGTAPGDKQCFKGAWLPENGGENEHKFSER